MKTPHDTSKELLIVRHGKSDWSGECDDFHRPLIERGKRGAELLGRWLQQQQIIPDFILSSPAVRALETAKRCCRAMGLHERYIYQEPRIYEANAATLKAILNECPTQAQRVMLVGHNPSLEHLLLDLSHQPPAEFEDGKLLPTATLAHLSLSKLWSQVHTGCGRTLSITRASSLNQTFPFTTLTGIESRERPAYYYAQSAVMPYWIEASELKLLLISTGSKEKWAFPKGVIEPGLSPQQSAAKEAREEAGLKGIVVDQSLGHYYREKWGGLCTIEIFPMLVTEMVNTHEWEEKHRQRQWFSPKEAVEALDNPELAKMIKQLLILLKRNETGHEK